MQACRSGLFLCLQLVSSQWKHSLNCPGFVLSCESHVLLQKQLWGRPQSQSLARSCPTKNTPSTFFFLKQSWGSNLEGLQTPMQTPYFSVTPSATQKLSFTKTIILTGKFLIQIYDHALSGFL